MIIEKKKLDLEKINIQAKTDPKALVDAAESAYSDMVDGVCGRMIDEGHSILLLSGPSASGKTTTAKRLKAALEKRGHNAVVISTDDFFNNYGEMPILEDGTTDTESIDTVNITLLTECLISLSEGKKTEMPVFDFSSSMRRDNSYTLQMGEGDIVIIEGIHALNPRITGNLPGKRILSVYADVGKEFDGISWRDIRFMRRMVRDAKFRSFPASGTVTMWDGVISAEEKYVIPFAAEADEIIDTAMSYELNFMRDDELDGLSQIVGGEYGSTARRLMEALDRLTKIEQNIVPRDSLIREFSGGLII